MKEKSMQKIEYDFVTKNIKHNIICVSGRKNNFTAIKYQGKWLSSI